MIWSYWEGPLPSWVEECQKSLLCHGGNEVKILNRDSFDDLWEYDRHLDLESRYIAHQADFIRAYLLRYYGGVWIDADALVMKPLEPLHETAKLWDLTFYKQSDGQIANNIIGAKEGSQTARRFYEIVRDRLENPKPLAWVEIGSDALLRAVRAGNDERLKLATDLVCPIHWNDQSRFTERGDDYRHRGGFNESSLIYLVSNHALGMSHKEADEALLKDDSFFNFLIKESSK